MRARQLAGGLAAALALVACQSPAEETVSSTPGTEPPTPPVAAPSPSWHPSPTGSGERITVAPGLVEYQPSIRRISTDSDTCNNPNPRLEVRETSTTVELFVTIDDVFNDDECLDIVSAILDDPLGDRAVIDGVTGSPVPELRRHTHVAGATTTLSPLPDEPLDVVPRDGFSDGVCNSDLVVAAADVVFTSLKVPPDALADGPPIAVGSHEVRALDGLPATMVLAQRSRLQGCDDTPWFLSIPAPGTPWAVPIDETAVCNVVQQAADEPCNLPTPSE